MKNHLNTIDKGEDKIKRGCLFLFSDCSKSVKVCLTVKEIT